MNWRRLRHIKIHPYIKRLAVLVAVLGLVSYILGELFFNVSSNMVALSFRESKEPLMVHPRNQGWKRATDVSMAELSGALVERHREEGLRWCSLAVRRTPRTLAQRVTQGLFGAELNVIWISPDKFDLMTSFKPKFAPTTAVERLEAESVVLHQCQFPRSIRQAAGLGLPSGSAGEQFLPCLDGMFFREGRSSVFWPQITAGRGAGVDRGGNSGISFGDEESLGLFVCGSSVQQTL